MHGVHVGDSFDADEAADFAVCGIDEALDFCEILVVDACFYDDRVFVVDEDALLVVGVCGNNVFHVAEEEPCDGLGDKVVLGAMDGVDDAATVGLALLLVDGEGGDAGGDVGLVDVDEELEGGAVDAGG